ncbi:MAG: hypothetical protein U0990_11300 [Candidatus Nanopelagicales bacterium]|nr:hypothetical protein [Candidatus Nanopelagicales bacterium]MDZ4250654.1 hypothetical protein [Candidatus Nanopelagicales bacterium]MDZ7578210.1 hypothetical protein [Candidatus Nanopelagicales bacterium]
MKPTAALADVGARGLIVKRTRRRFSRIPTLAGGKDRRPYWILRNVTMEVNPGEALFIVDSSTHRRQTVMRLMSGLVDPDEGSVVVPPRSLLLPVPRFRQVKTLSIGQSLRLLAGIHGMTDREIDERFDSIAERAGVRRIIHRPVDETSSFMLRQLAFCVATSAPVNLLALDSMAEVGTQGFRPTCVPQLQDLMSKGMALVVVSRDPKLLRTLATRVVLLTAKGAAPVDPDTAVQVMRTMRSEARVGRRRTDEDDRDDEV